MWVYVDTVEVTGPIPSIADEAYILVSDPMVIFSDAPL
jgi:hypothetical protein